MVQAEIRKKKIIGLGPGQIFAFCFVPGQARVEILISFSDWADKVSIQAGQSKQNLIGCTI